MGDLLPDGESEGEMKRQKQSKQRKIYLEWLKREQTYGHLLDVPRYDELIMKPPRSIWMELLMEEMRGK